MSAVTNFRTSVTSTLTCWPWNYELDFRYSEDCLRTKMNFLGQGFRQIQHEQGRQTDRRDRTHYHSHIREWQDYCATVLCPCTLTENWSRGAAGRRTTTSFSHSRRLPRIATLYYVAQKTFISLMIGTERFRNSLMPYCLHEPLWLGQLLWTMYFTYKLLLQTLDTNLNFILRLFTLYYCSVHCINPAFVATRNKPLGYLDKLQLISHPIEGRRLSWSEHTVGYQLAQGCCVCCSNGVVAIAALVSSCAQWFLFLILL